MSEETSRIEDNASTEKDDTDDAKETSVEAAEAEITKTEVSDDEQTSETESSLRKEVEEAESTEETETETEDAHEEVEEDTLQTMVAGNTYTLNVGDMAAITKGDKSDGEEVLLSDNYFSLICSASTQTEANKSNTFYYLGAEDGQVYKEAITQRLSLGGAVNISKQSVKFITAGAVDVTVYWVGGDNGRQMSILNESGTVAAETAETTVKSGVYVSTMTLEQAGTYYLGGNNYTYKIIVEPKKSKETYMDWDFSDKTKFPEMSKTDNTVQGFQKCTLDYYGGLKVDTNSTDVDGVSVQGKFYVRSDNNVQINQGTVIRVPIDGRSKVTVTMYQGGTYTVDGVEADAADKTETFICSGDSGYATIKIIKTGEYLQSIKTEKIKQHTVSGSVTGLSEDATDIKVVFTDKEDSSCVIEADVTSGNYSADLYEGSTYTISISDNSYSVTDPSSKEIEVDATDKTVDITVQSVDRVNVSGSLSIPSDASLDNLQISFKAEDGDEVEATIENNAWSADLAQDTTYTVTASAARINDYTIDPSSIEVGTAAITNKTIQLTEKQKYKVTVTAESFDNNIDLSGTKLTFTNINEEGYTYDFTGIDNIELRDGTYTLDAEVSYPYVLETPKQLVVSGAAVSEYAINFTERTEWSFRTGSVYQDGAVHITEGKTGSLDGLEIDCSNKGKLTTSGRQDWAQANTNTIIKVPVRGASVITTTWSGSEAYTIDGVAKTGSDSYTYKGTADYVEIVVTNGGYLGSIKSEPLPTVKVSGSVTLPSGAPSGIKLIFTEQTTDESKLVVEADIKDDNSYEADLCTGVTYKVSLSNKDYGIIVPTNAEVSVAADAAAEITQNIEAESVSLTEVTGTVTFPTGKEIPDNLKLTFTEKNGSLSEEVSVSGGSYTVSLKPDTIYTVTAAGTRINDYELNTDEINTASTDTTIVFSEKQKYKVTVTAESFDDSIDLSSTKLTFTNVNEEGYTYDFTGIDSIMLRDGTYALSMSVDYPYELQTPEQLTINKANTDYTLTFTERTEWSFKRGTRNVETVKISEGQTGTVSGLEIDCSNNGKFDLTSNEDWAQVNTNTIIKVPVSGKCEISTAWYGSEKYTIDDVEATGSGSYTYKGTAGFVTIAVTNGGYLGSITVKPIADVVVPDGPRTIDVWDFGGKEETDTNKYTNNITPQKWIDSGLTGEVTDSKGNKNPGRFFGGTSTSYTYDFGDLTMNYIGQDRLYSKNSSLTTPIVAGSGAGTADKTYDDGYAADGGWYCNGSGSETTRNITINNVVAGDKIVVYAGQHMGDDAHGPITWHFDGQGLAVGQNDSVSLGAPNRVFKKLVFIAENSGSYKIWPECENDGKPLYNRVMRIPGVSVSGSVNFGSFNIGSDYTIKFVNQTTKQETIIELAEDGSFKTALASGYTYMAVLSGAAGYGFASEGKYVEIAENSDAIENVTLVVEEKDRYTYSGKLTGFEEGYDISRIAITMLPPADSSADEVELTIDKEAKGFTALLDSGVEYTLEMTGVDDYNVKDPLTVKNTVDVTSDITVELKPRYTVSGGFIGLGDAEITELKFTYIDADGKTDSNYAYTATVTGGSYSIDLRDGSYLASAVVEGYKTQTHVVVNGGEVTKDLLFVSTASDTTLERVANLYVGYPNKPNNYKTVSAAVKAAKRMKPSNESERITIHIAPGTYREQIIVDVPYITFTNDEAPKEVKLTWYYGIGYAYYSIKSGYYNEESAHDKYEKANADRWGCAVKVAASDFRAENIVFENSFNRYITEEEIADGVELHTEGTDSKATFVRKADTTEKEAASKAATERAAAIALDADRAEFYQCEFYGSQDTVYTGSYGYHSYFKDCLIEGNTDFLFGDSNSVYDNCRLSFAGYSDGKYAGMIAVNQAGAQHGYLFWGCTIVKGTTWNNGYGDLGRPWRANARVTFVNTVQETADIVTATGWQDMSGASAADNPNYKEYNTTSLDGKTITMKSPRKDKYVTENPVEDMTVYFDGWTPVYLDYDASQVVKDPVSDEKRSDVPKGTTITLTSATEGAKIYYTMDGTEPTASSTEYTAPISLGDEAKTITIKAIAIKGDIQSNIAVFEYNVVDAENLIAAPTASVEPGKVEKGTKVKLVCATEGADIYYTTDGTEPAVKSALLYKNQEIVINQTTTIKAIAEKGGNVSTVAEFTYTVEAPVTEVVEAPEADVTPGKVAKGTTVSLTCATEGAVIYYTMDETEPTEKSMVYTAPISLGNEVRKVIIKAIAVKAGKTSTVSTFEYAVSEDGTVEKQQVQAPKATPAAGAVAAGTTVTLTSDTADAKIYYTTDGKVPTTADTLYTEPIAITAAVTIQAVAVKEGWKDSEVVAFAYTITGEPDVPPVDVKRIKLEECEITVPSVMRDTSKKADPKQPSATYVTYKYTDESGEEKHVKFAENLDYSVVWNGAASAEDKTVYSVTLTGLGRTVDQFEIDTESTVTVNYKVYDKPDKNSKVKIVDISKAKIGLDASAKTAVYTGYAIEPKLDFTKDKDNLKDKVNIAYRNNINAGKATVTISAKPDAGDENTVYVGSKTLTFTIKKAALNKTAAKATAKVVWDESFSFTAGHDYTGKPVTVTGLKVESSKGRTLEPDEDYTVTYKNNAKAGKATVTVKGIGNNLSGSWTQSFTIKTVDLSKLKLNKDVKPVYSPKGARLAEIEVLGENGEKLYTLKEGTDYTAKYVYSDKKKAAGSKVTVTISGKGACTGKNIKLGDFEIIKGDFATCITVPEDIAVDGKDLAKELAKAITVTDASGAKLSVKKNYTIGTPDKETKTVELKPVDTKNYENSYIVKFRVATNLAKDKGFVFDKKASLSYDGRNPVKLTADDITKYVGAKYKLGENIEIVPGTYKNNTKKGTASVTVRGKAGVDGGFYGTKVLKFKIVEK